MASIAAVAVIVASSLVWLRDYASTGMVPMLPVLGAASAVTFVIATAGFPIAAVSWIAGLPRVARTAGTTAFTCWVLTAVVFQILLGGSLRWGGAPLSEEAVLLAWTFLFGAATIGVWQPPPPARRVLAVVVVALAIGALAFAGTGAQRAGASTYRLVGGTHPWLPAILDQGRDTLHTGARVAWVLLVLSGGLLWRLDPRPAMAGLWLVPFVALSHLSGFGIAGIATGAVAVVGLLALGAVHAPREPHRGR